MTPLQLELTKLIGKKELTFGCLIKITEATDSYNEGGLCEYGGPVEENIYPIGGYFLESEGMDENFIKNWKKEVGDYILHIEIIGHPVTLTDLHGWMNDKGNSWFQDRNGFGNYVNSNKVPYNSSKELLDQDEETLKQIVELIRNNQ